jgi:hypothetical protein
VFCVIGLNRLELYKESRKPCPELRFDFPANFQKINLFFRLTSSEPWGEKLEIRGKSLTCYASLTSPRYTMHKVEDSRSQSWWRLFFLWKEISFYRNRPPWHQTFVAWTVWNAGIAVGDAGEPLTTSHQICFKIPNAQSAACWRNWHTKETNQTNYSINAIFLLIENKTSHAISGTCIEF